MRGPPHRIYGCPLAAFPCSPHTHSGQALRADRRVDGVTIGLAYDLYNSCGNPSIHKLAAQDIRDGLCALAEAIGNRDH